MGTTANYALRYPEPTDNVELWTHFSNLATDVDTAVHTVAGPKICKLRQAAAQTITSSTDTKLLFGASSEDSDALGWHSTATNTSRITPTLTGWYDVIVHNVWKFNTALNYSDVMIYKNGALTDRLGNQQLPIPNGNNVSKSGGYLLMPLTVDTVGDYFEMGVFHASTGAVTLDTNGGAGTGAPVFVVRYAGPLT